MGSLPWFRVYVRIADDAKLVGIPEEFRWRFVAILAFRGRGDVPTSDDDTVAALLRITPRAAKATKRILIERGLIGADWSPLAWDQLQYASDTSTPRVRKHRAKLAAERAVTETTVKRFRNGPDTETDTEGPAASASMALVAAGPAPSRDSATVGRAAAPPGCPEGPGRGPELRAVVETLAAQAAIRRN